MAKKDLRTSIKIREMAREAVKDGCTTPAQLRDYFENNGWDREVPTYPTLQTLLKENGIVFIHGRWEKVND